MSCKAPVPLFQIGDEVETNEKLTGELDTKEQVIIIRDERKRE